MMIVAVEMVDAVMTVDIIIIIEMVSVLANESYSWHQWWCLTMVMMMMVAMTELVIGGS